MQSKEVDISTDVTEQLVYKLPRVNDDCRAMFMSMGRLLNCSQLSHQENSFTISTPNLFPATVFECDSTSSSTSIVLRNVFGEATFLSNFFSRKNKPTDTLVFQDIEKILAGKIVAIDHTGLVLPSAQTKATDWLTAVRMLAAGTVLCDYPESPEYNPESSRWLFALPASRDEFLLDTPRLIKSRQPKFELVWDINTSDETILQIDIETSLDRQQIATLLPTSYELPGLGDFFRSVNIQSPWSGISFVRLDLRYQDDGSINEWKSGKWLLERGQRVHRNSPQNLLPKVQ